MKQTKKQQHEIQIRPDLATTFIDSFSIGIRSDGLVGLSGMNLLPNQMLVEEVRFIISQDHARKLSESLVIALAEFDKIEKKKKGKSTSTKKKTSPKKTTKK